MKTAHSGARALLASAAALGLAIASSQFLGARNADELGRTQPVVLELFTSQGCSSCPPADALLRELGAQDDVVALSFHVDYWNRLGWQDPYSSARWSERQERYVVALAGDNLYTPQIVIDGQLDVVGSNRRRLLQMIEQRRDARDAGPALSVEVSAIGKDTEISVVASSELSDPVDLLILIAENGIETHVRRGENARRTLRHDHVVRSIETFSAWRGGARRARLSAEPSWSAEHLEIVVLAQSLNSRSIVAATKLPWPTA